MDVETTNFAAAVPLGIAAANVLRSLGFAAERDFHVWRGTSGRGYLHSVYSLYGCPEVVDAGYLLVKLSPSGRRTGLQSGVTVGRCGSLNLAEIRRNAARLGANEIHIHQLSPADDSRQLIDSDLRPMLREVSATMVATGPAATSPRLHS